LPDVFLATRPGVGSPSIFLVILELPDVFIAIRIGEGSLTIGTIALNASAPAHAREKAKA